MINSRDEDGCTPLYMIIRFAEDVAAATWLIEHGADVGAVDDDNCTIFATARSCMTTEFVKYLNPLVPPKHLTQANDSGNTPVMYA